MKSDLGFNQAYKNICKFMEDCEVPVELLYINTQPSDNGRYYFELGTDIEGVSFKTEYGMPSVPLERVRYINDEQNMLEFATLHGGGHWYWKFALIKKEEVLEHLKYKNEELNHKIINIKKEIETNTRLIKKIKREDNNE